MAYKSAIQTKKGGRTMKKILVFFVILVVSIAIPLALAEKASAEKSVTIRYGTDLPPHLPPVVGQHWWADAVTKGTAYDDEEAFQEVKNYFTTRQIVEMTFICGLWNLSGRLTEPFRQTVEPPEKRIGFKDK